jgi:transposase
MIQVDQFMDIKSLHQEGHSIHAIVRMTGLSRNTVRKVLRGEHTLKLKVSERSSKLDTFKSYLKERFEQTQLSAVRLLEEIQGMGYDGSIATVRRYLQTLKPEKRRQEKLTVRFETPPGKQAQADWGYCGRHPTPEGSGLAVYVFVMVLSFSRQLFIRFTTSMRMPELIACHQAAFDYFNGWPDTILYDNMKQVKLSRRTWNEQFLDFAHHYGFIPKTHQAYRPRTKGKVERAVEYVKDNFLKGRCFDNLTDLNAQAQHWLDHTANSRIHGTTGMQPHELFKQEQLTPLSSIAPYRYLDPVNRTVNYEALVHFQGSRYSVPPEHAGKTVQVSAQGGQIIVHCGDMIIAEHRQALKPGQCMVDREHLAQLWKLTQQQTRVPDTHPDWQLTFNQPVQHMSLQQFEEVAQ